MTIQGLRAHWGFTRTPFTKDLAPSMLHRHAGHAEAVARIHKACRGHPSAVRSVEGGGGNE
jgi:type II secretory pathway predicted ATPase ExeA